MNNRRYYGIDLLRSASMLMIVILHILGVGGVMDKTEPGSAQYMLAWLMETACMCSVDCFGLVSGYVLSKGRHRYSRIVSLWLRVILECLAVTAVCKLIIPDKVTGAYWLAAVTPIYHGIYWYFTAYFALFFFAPFINKMIAALSKREMLVLGGSIVFIFCLLNNLTLEELYSVSAGYSFLWLCCLYVLGAIIRGLEIKDGFSWLWLLAGFALPVLAAWLLMLRFHFPRFISYTSPFILMASMALLLLFRRLHISSPRAVKLVDLLNRTSFGVYIIHTNALIWNFVLVERFAFLAQYSAPLMVLGVLACALAVYIPSAVGDWLIEKLMKLARIDLLEREIDKFCDKYLKTRQKPQNTTEN